MRELIERFMREWPEAKRQTLTDNPYGSFVRRDIPDKLYESGLVDSDKYLITGSVGQGNWATIPWVAVFDRTITTTATKGIYIVYLLSSDAKRLYLTFNQGCSEISAQHGKPETIQILHQRAEEIRSRVDSRGFVVSSDINLGDNLPTKGIFYKEGTIFYRQYDLEAIPEEKKLQEDLALMIQIYQDYVISLQGSSRLGVFDSWTILNENTAIKKCDKSFFEHNGSGIPREITWFFDADQLSLGESTPVKLWYQGEEYEGKIRIESTELGRARIFWEADLGKQWKRLQGKPGVKATFYRKGKGEFEIVTAGDEKAMKVSEKLNAIKAYIGGKGFTYEDQLIENFYLSLKSKPFVILAGTSGTGKTKLVRLFAEAIGAKNRYSQVAVRPDWSDSTDLFGHLDLNGRFVKGCILDFLTEAQRNPDFPYILCLDEMNLARVEYYLSDFLSVIETREFQGDKIVTDPLVKAEFYGHDDAARKTYGPVFFPENLYVVGTVNMDETTFPFSRKVLDRANTIEFNYVDLVPDFIGTVESNRLLEKNSFLKSEYLMLAQCSEDEQETVREYCMQLEKINRILQTANAHVGYRVRDEICFYLLNNRSAGLMTDDQALDYEIMQKILPRIQGSSASLKDMLCRLFKEILAGDYDRQGGDAAGMEKKLNDPGNTKIRFPRSAEKVMFMVRRFEEDGFTSYWL